jgi:serine/threonine-protein kinase
MKVLRTELGADSDMLQRFITEARAVNQIGHANIVDIFDFGTLGDDRPYMVMEWLRGETLGDRMRAPLTHAETCDLLLPIASALEAAHAAGIAHRDLKPDNVFLARTSRQTTVKLLDFGIAKLLKTNQEMEKTQTGMVMGTPAYMSPEQGRGKDVDHRTDIYALGIIAFEMFCRRPPFIGDTAMDLVVAHIHTPPPAPSSIAPGLSPAIDSLLLEMLEKDAAARPTIQQIMVALDEIRAGNVHLTALPPRRPTPFPFNSNTPLPYLATSAPSQVPHLSAAPRKSWRSRRCDRHRRQSHDCADVARCARPAERAGDIRFVTSPTRAVGDGRVRFQPG